MAVAAAVAPPSCSLWGSAREEVDRVTRPCPHLTRTDWEKPRPRPFGVSGGEQV